MNTSSINDKESASLRPDGGTSSGQASEMRNGSIGSPSGGAPDIDTLGGTPREVPASATSFSTIIPPPPLPQVSTPSTAGSSRSNLATSPRRASASTTPRAARRDKSGNTTTGATASSYLSNQNASTSTPSPSLFGFLGGPRPVNEDAAMNQIHGWRSLSTSNLPTRVSDAEGHNRSSSYLSDRYRNMSNGNQQSRPAITSFLGDITDTDYGWNANRNRNNNNNNRGATVAALQQQHQQNSQHQSHLADSPARRHATINGASSPWLSAIHGQNGSHHHTMASSSGWTLADPAAWNGWSINNGKACSSFEENQIVAFTWLIPEANLLRDEVETSPLPSEGARSVSAGAGKSEVWTTQPIFGDGKWKLELVRMNRLKEKSKENDEDMNSSVNGEQASTTVLSVYITSMVLDYSPADMEIPATIMIGIKPMQCQTKASRSGSWIWREFSNYKFRRENEYFECHNLPSMSDLLMDSNVQRHDAFSLTIQISTGPSAAMKSVEQGISSTVDVTQNSPFEVQDNHLVHHSLINGLERLLDCRSTGDVVLIARERGVLNSNPDDEESQEKIWPLPIGKPMYDWAQLDVEKEGYTPIVVRDRCLWAHSSILCARSEYFNDMLQSHFAEGQEQRLPESSGEVHLGGRKIKTLRIESADFTTMYWLLRYLYLEEVEFASDEDIHCSALDDDWMTTGLVSHPELSYKARWQWTPLSQLESLSEGISTPVPMQQNLPSTAAFTSGLHNRNASSKTPSHMMQNTQSIPSSPDRPRIRSPQQMYNSFPRRSTSDHSRRRSIEVSNGYTAERGSVFQPLHQDPENHPCAKASLASALALYKLAHRFNQQELLQLTKTHLINTLHPQSAFQVLLASFLYTDLYEHVKAYVLDKWDQVNTTREFEQCCDEVSAGEWGFEAGRALRVFMQSLTSPNRAR